jgi:predicted phage replisome organizer
MAEIKWIKITTDMFEDEKIDYISTLPDADSIIIIWVRLLAMAGKCNTGGYVFLTENIPYTEEMLANKFKKNVNTIKLAMATFQMLGMIEIIDGRIFIVNFEKHQNIDGMEKIKEQTRQRVIRHRQKLKQLEAPKEVVKTDRDNGEIESDSNATCNVTVTQCNAIDKDQDKDQEYNNISSGISSGHERDDSITHPDKSVDITDRKEDPVQEVFEAWNKINVIKHHQVTVEIKADINKALKKSPKDEILKAIERYGTMFHDKSYYLCQYKWGIHEFLTRKEGFLRFLDDGSKWLNYQEHLKLPANKPNQQAPPAPQAQNFKQRQYSSDFYEKFKKAGIE